MAYSGSGLGNSYKGNSYSYSMSHAGRSGYGLSTSKAYGTDINLRDYLGKGKGGLAGYVDNLLHYASKSAGFYPDQKKNEVYKNVDSIVKYELTSKGLNLINGELLKYELPSMRRPSVNLERMVGKSRRTCPSCGIEVGLVGSYSMN